MVAAVANETTNVSVSSNTASDLAAFLKQHVRRKGSKDVIQTHTALAVADRPTTTFSIPLADEPFFHQQYFAYVKSLGNSLGINTFTEKIRHLFPFFMDIDFDIGYFEKKTVSKDNVKVYLDELIKFTHALLKDTFGKQFDGYIVKRLFYKVHLHFPDVFVTQSTALSLIHAIQTHMNRQFPNVVVQVKKSATSTVDDLIWNKVIDKQVYSTGIRMLLSHKGNIAKADEEPRHRALFPEEPYSQCYDQVFKVDHNAKLTRMTIEATTLSLLSIRRTADEPLSIKNPSLIADAQPPRFVRPKKTKSTEKADSSQPGMEESELGTVVTPDLEDKLMDTKDMIDSASAVALFRYLQQQCEKQCNGLTLDLKDIKRLPGTKYLCVLPSNMTECPLANRMHSRSTGQNPRSPLWVLVTPFHVTLRCWSASCQGKCHSFGELPQDLRARLFNMNGLDVAMYKALHFQTIEHITEYLFELLREKHAAVPENDGCTTFSWYTYSASRHRWAREKRIILDIMKEHGIVQKTMSRFVDKLIQECESKEEANAQDQEKDDDTASAKKKGKKEDGAKKIGSLWFALRNQLQNGNFVQSSLLGVLGLKIHLWTIETYGDAFSNLLDNKPHILGFTNGVFDFKQRCFRKGEPSDFISLSTKLAYREYKEYPKDVRSDLEASLAKLLPEKEEFDSMLSEIASCLDGTPRTQRFFILTGHGSNGKSTLVKLINFAMGDYAGESDVSLFTKPRPPSNAPTEDVFSLKGKRFVVCHEPNERDQLYLGTVKWITGGDRITARALYGHQQHFYLQCTVFMLCNSIPQVRAGQDDYGAWRRLKPREFKCRFVEKPSAPNEYPIDPTINDKLDLWKEAFIALLVRYNLCGQSFPVPESFKLFERQLQENSNHYARFYKEHIKTDNVQFPVPIEDVYKTFNLWLRKEGLDKRVPCHEFARQMAPHLGKELSQSVEDEHGKKCWQVRLQSLLLF